MMSQLSSLNAMLAGLNPLHPDYGERMDAATLMGEFPRLRMDEFPELSLGEFEMPRAGAGYNLDEFPELSRTPPAAPSLPWPLNRLHLPPDFDRPNTRAELRGGGTPTLPTEFTVREAAPPAQRMTVPGMSGPNAAPLSRMGAPPALAPVPGIEQLSRARPGEDPRDQPLLANILPPPPSLNLGGPIQDAADQVQGLLDNRPPFREPRRGNPLVDMLGELAGRLPPAEESIDLGANLNWLNNGQPTIRRRANDAIGAPRTVVPQVQVPPWMRQR